MTLCGEKRAAALLLAALMLLGAFPLLRTQAQATDIADSAVFLKQEAGQRRCTMVSALMMIRRKLILEGRSDWTGLTEQSAKGELWGSSGLPWNFTYAGVSVTTYGMKSDLGLTTTEQKKFYFISSLASHPEGIVIYNHSYPHAVLLTRYDSGTDTLYCADPAGKSVGEIPLADCTIPGKGQDAVIGNINQVWVVTGYNGSTPVPTPAEPALSARDRNMLVNVGEGSTLRFCASWSSTSARLASIPNGDTVYVYGVTTQRYDGRYWAKISWSGTVGWVNLEWLAEIPTAKRAFSIVFNANGGQGGPSYVEKQEGETIQLPWEEPTRHGYMFFGWAESPNYSEVGYVPGGDYSEDGNAVLYALWIALDSDISTGAGRFDLTAGGERGAAWISYAKSWMTDPTLLISSTDPSVAVAELDASGKTLLVTPLRAGDAKIILRLIESGEERSRTELPVHVEAAPLPAELLNFRYAKSCDGRFRDVKKSDWFYDNVAAAYSLSLMQGRSADCFAVDGTLSAAEAITVAARLNAIYYTGSDNFAAPSAGEPWYAEYVRYADENGILPDGAWSWDMNAPIDRARFAQVLAGALPEEALPSANWISDGAIPDVSLTLTAAPSIYTLYRAGILAGSDSSGTFRPDDTITRKEAAAILTRLADPELRLRVTLL